jgi:hypothetical protein
VLNAATGKVGFEQSVTKFDGSMQARDMKETGQGYADVANDGVHFNASYATRTLGLQLQPRNKNSYGSRLAVTVSTRNTHHDLPRLAKMWQFAVNCGNLPY